MIRFDQIGGLIDGIYWNDGLIGQVINKPGGSVKFYRPVAESLEDEVVAALEEREGKPDPSRVIVHHITDPRRVHKHVFTRSTAAMDESPNSE